MPVEQLRSSPVTKMRLFAVMVSALLLTEFCSGGPATLTPESGTCWVMGNLHNTFDGFYYTFMGNCTYTMAKNCHVDADLPAFEVDTMNMNEGNIQVPSVGALTVNVYGFHIEVVRSELGIVRVNYQKWNLPINLNNGQVKLFQRGFLVSIETDFNLIVQYDWNEYVAITVPAGFAGSVCGLCGNFNNKNEDDLTLPDGSVASSLAAFGKSWRVPSATDVAPCEDECAGQCDNCALTEVQSIEAKILCSSLLQNFAGLVGCQPVMNADLFQGNCMLDICQGEEMQTYLCKSLQGFADVCQRSGAKTAINWRNSTQCPIPKCPENSHYEFCGSSCPATCANPNSPTKCNTTCVEACSCNDGFLLSGTKCVQKSQCGCMYNGHYVEVGTSFWGSDSCTKRYTCSADGKLTSVETSCPAGQQCQVVAGIRDCYPVNYATCMVSGDPHFVTFDGLRYNFQGTCSYQMAGVSNQSSLEHFSVVLQNNGQDKKIGSAVSLIEVNVYGYSIVISKEYRGSVLVNGELFNLPMMLDNDNLHLYTSGWFAVIETNFGVKVYYDWNSVVFLIIPSTYKDAMQGLCGNYNHNPKDDMQMRDGKQAATSEQFGQSWKVGTTAGCVDGCNGPCPGCNSTQRAAYTSNSYCGLISDPAGPFRDCHSKLDPAGFLSDCVDDVCLYQGSSNIQCKTLTAYTAACQLIGATVYAWRSAQFCDVQIPSNSHYELCSSDCFRSCETDSALSNCEAPCMEGFVCDDGYLLSGDECVPPDQCGCNSEGKYYQHDQVFYPDALCQEECTCNGTVQCVQSTCGPYAKCEINNYVRSCQPLGRGSCSIYGDPHYSTFDNTYYDFQGTCTYIVAEGCHLSGTRLKEFSVVVENEKWDDISDNPDVSVAKLVAVTVYDTILILRRNEAQMVWINGVLHHLPQSLYNGAVKVYQQGLNDVIMTDFGLQVMYDLVYYVSVIVPGTYMDKTCGLCGNFNGDKTDEFQLPNGSVTRNVQTFGAAWNVSEPGVVCDSGCSGDLCPKCDDSEKAKLEAQCAIITNPTGPFASCHDIIDPASYFRNCVYDVCMAKGNTTMLCHSISGYMSDCQTFGAKIPNWRSPSFCPLTCNAGSHYETCMLPCTAVCPGLIDTITCTNTCFEGCACDKGYYNNGTGCVPFDECSCYLNGQTYKIGESIITDNCDRIHTCQASGIVLSKNMSCDSNENCMIKDGKMGCYIQQCLMDSNGTLTTFIGKLDTITKPGAYEIIKNCNQLQTADWFRVVVKMELCTPGVNTITTVYMFFNDVMITLDSKHDVWVNGKPLTQTNFSQNNVNVVVSGGTVTISSSSTIQLSFSSTNELAMSVSDNVADVVCGACGKLRPTDASLKDHGASTSLNIGQWIAPDFSQCNV